MNLHFEFVLFSCIFMVIQILNKQRRKNKRFMPIGLTIVG
jgi:hypothetical protein